MNHGEFRKSPGTINRGQPEAWRDWGEGMGAIHPGSEIKTESWKSMSILPRNITQEWKHRSDIYQVYKNTDTDSDASWWYFQKKKKNIALSRLITSVIGTGSWNQVWKYWIWIANYQHVWVCFKRERNVFEHVASFPFLQKEGRMKFNPFSWGIGIRF